MVQLQTNPHQFKLDPVPGQQWRLVLSIQPQLGLVARCLLGVQGLVEQQVFLLILLVGP
jgi:hypothetical protein